MNSAFPLICKPLPRPCGPLLAAAFLALSACIATAQQPMQIREETVKTVKQATVLLHVTGTDGKVGHGSGFLVVEPGLVVTNAHVVGMLSAKSQPPSKIEVVVHSGETNEFRLSAQVLGVDRVADLAVLKVETKGKLPAALKLGVKDKLYETQKLYIFGFPFGTELGKNITVSESSISSLRKDASGALEKIQVNGGMHPGNSGGPVTNAQGDVVAVSRSGIKGTQINFAIPAASVQAFLEGGIQEARPGEVFRKNEELHVSVQYDCLDPFQRIREVRVEVWPGKPDDKRTFSSTQAKPQEGDGPRQSVTLKYAKSVASGEVPLPKLAPGQVAWVQPVVVLAKGERWGPPQSFDEHDDVGPLVARLIELVKDRQVALEKRIRACANIGQQGAKAKPAIPVIIEFFREQLNQKNPQERLQESAIITALGVLRAAKAKDIPLLYHEVIQHCLKAGPTTLTNVFEQAVQALDHIGFEDEHVPLLAQIVYHTTGANREYEKTAGRALGKIGTAKATKVLITIATASKERRLTPAIRQLAVTGLAQIAVEKGDLPQGREAFLELQVMAATGDAEVEAAAAGAVERVKQGKKKGK